jgi:hypothetical protein
MWNRHYAGAMEVRQRHTREPWNNGKLIDQKPPLRPKHRLVDPYPIADGGTDARLGDVQSGNRQHAAGCDVVAVRVEDVAPSGYDAAEEDRSARQV